MKKNRILIVSVIVVILSMLGIGVSQLKGKGIPTNMKDYIGQPYETLPNQLKHKGIEFILGEHNQVIELIINKEGYTVDSIQIGDTIEKIYRVYPKDWIQTREHTIQITYGKEIHYGVATDYIIYTISKNKQVQSILVGKTASFTQQILPESNALAKKLINGEWVSKSNHKLTFKSYILEDNYLDSLWDQQYYIILAPNTLIISRQKENNIEKVKLYFWVSEKELYVFAIDQEGKPIKESIEIFFRT